MKYLGIVKHQDGNLTLPDAFEELEARPVYEAVQIGGDILLLSMPLDRERMHRIEWLTNRSIEEHRPTLEGLAR